MTLFYFLCASAILALVVAGILHREAVREYEYHFLAVAHMADSPLTGTQMRNAVDETRQVELSIGLTYVVLDRLIEKGLLTWEWGKPTLARGGRRPMLYKITDAGTAAIAQCITENKARI